MGEPLYRNARNTHISKMVAWSSALLVYSRGAALMWHSGTGPRARQRINAEGRRGWCGRGGGQERRGALCCRSFRPSSPPSLFLISCGYSAACQNKKPQNRKRGKKKIVFVLTFRWDQGDDELWLGSTSQIHSTSDN